MTKVLLIEDQDFTATLLETVLRKAGFVVAHAKDGEKGLAAFNADRPDLRHYRHRTAQDRRA